MNQINKLIESIFSNDISTFFAFIIFVVLLLSVISRFRPLNGVLGGMGSSGPTLLTTLGILGTFTGIFIGLLEFDVSDIDSSVPQLLVGLKIAFVTSILGIASAILLKIFQAIKLKPRSTEDNVTPDIIHSTLESISQGIAEASKNEIRQVRKLRGDIKNGQKELIKEFRDFASTIAENNSTALIEALEKVIRDFNTQLNEQFGENFKQLNNAVEALVSWQENYRVHVESLEENFKNSVDAIESSEEALRQIVSHTETIPNSLEKQEVIIQGISDAITDLNDHLDAVGGLKDRALDAFPTIEKNLERLTTDLTSTVEGTVAKTSEAFEIQRAANQTLHEGFENLLNGTKEIHSRFEQVINDSFKSIRSSLEGALDSTKEGITDRFDEFDKNMQSELNECIGLLGKNLASLSEKFVDDYSPLTDRLRDVVQIAGKV